MVGEETFHPDTRALLAYGRALAGAGPAPKKGGADHVLDRLMVIERAKDGRLPIRTFGADLIGLFGRDLRDHDFCRFFLAPDLWYWKHAQWGDQKMPWPREDIEACGRRMTPGQERFLRKVVSTFTCLGNGIWQVDRGRQHPGLQTRVVRGGGGDHPRPPRTAGSRV